jgi:selenocysteine lyase/cysteine desulfurase
MFHSGQRNDLASIIALAKRHNIEVVVDVMQSVGILPLDVTGMDAFAVASGTHKGLLTPQGLGFLCTSRDSAQLPPTYVAAAGVANLQPDLVAGPESVEVRANARRFEIGNFNLAAIYGLGAALMLIDRVGVPKIEEHVLDLGDQLLAGVDQLGIKLVGPREREHRSHIYVLGITGPDWPAFLITEGVRISHVRDGIRVSFGLYNNPDDVDRFMNIVRRGLSTIGRGTA